MYQWRAVSSTLPVEPVWDQETLTVAGVCCIMCKCILFTVSYVVVPVVAQWVFCTYSNYSLSLQQSCEFCLFMLMVTTLCEPVLALHLSVCSNTTNAVI